jgi:MFS family permease
MASLDEQNPEMWPPGTVRLEAFTVTKGKDIILQPRPSDDPNDPLNWSNWRKNWNFALCSFYAMMVFALIDAATPTWGPMNVELGFSYSILNDSYAIGCGTLAFGAFLLIPFAVKYGRRPIYVVSTLAQFAVSVWSAKLETVADLLLVNAFSCMVGALAEVIVQMTIADIYFVHHRGLANTVYVWFSNFGSSLAPVAAGYITLSQGWRWVWWWCAIFFGVCAVLFFFSYEETKFSNSQITGVSPESQRDPSTDADHKSSILQEKILPVEVTSSCKKEEESQTQDLSIPTVINPNIPRKTYWQRLAFATTSTGSFKDFARHGYQPAVVLFTFPAVFYMSWVYGVMLAWSTVMVTVLSSTMTLPPYNFDSAQIGLMSLPSFIGTTLGALLIGPISDRSILYLAHRNHGVYEPEMRLWAMAPFVPFVPAGALMFGIGLNNGLSWPIVAVGYAICNFGTAPISTIALTYITDSYTDVYSYPLPFYPILPISPLITNTHRL